MLHQLANGNFIGIYWYNSNAQEVRVQWVGESEATVTFIASGGALDMFFFTGPQANTVIKQFHQVIGKPKMVPYYAAGYFYQVNPYSETNPDLMKQTVDYYEQNELPLEAIGVSLTSLKDQENFQVNFDVYLRSNF